MQKSTKSRFSREERLLIVREFETTSITRDELAQKYGISNGALISIWKLRFENEKKCVPLQPKPITEHVPLPVVPAPQTSEGMAKKQYNSVEEELKALREELAAKERELQWERDRNFALETLIEVAEENGMPVKKLGAKQ